MRKLLVLMLIPLFAVCSKKSTTEPLESAIDIQIDNTSPYQYTPNPVHLAVGGTITWHFPATLHDIVFSKTVPGFPTPDIPPTQSQLVTRTFATAGIYDYSCDLHPDETGQIIVE